LEQVLLILVVALAFVLAFINGFHDGFNVIANSVLSRSMIPVKALLFACIATFFAPLLFGTAVATTIGKEIINPAFFNRAACIAPMLFIISGLVSAIVWSLMTWWVGLPPSSSHALLGGLVGGGIAAFGFDIVNWSKLLFKACLFLFMSPLAGVGLAFLVMRISASIYNHTRGTKKDFFKQAQWFSLICLSAGHGTNNAQKAMGIITMVLVVAGSIQAFEVPPWAVLGCALALTLGVSAGGWKLLRILGDRSFRIKPIHAFNAQFTGGVIFLFAGLIGSPISTTQIVKSTIIGVGAGYRKRTVRMMLIKDIMMAWLITIPAAAFLSATIYWTVSGALGHGMGSFESIMKLFGQ